MKKYTISIFQLGWLLSILSVFTLTNSVNAQEWVQKADMINPRLFFSVAAVDKEIYVIGGMLGAPIDSVEAYLPETNKWVKKASLPSARAGVVTCEVDGKLYAIGGWMVKILLSVQLKNMTRKLTHGRERRRCLRRVHSFLLLP